MKIYFKQIFLIFLNINKIYLKYAIISYQTQKKPFISLETYKRLNCVKEIN